MSLRLHNISHRFNRMLAVDNADISVTPGEILCLFGPSGCGKTTLLRLAAGLEPLQHGLVELDGNVLAVPGRETPPEKRKIGFVFQDFVLFPHLTVQQNIAFGCDGSKKAVAASVDKQLQEMGLSELAKRYPFELSGGQQQRAALARALIRDPRALLLDEPFASIDTALRRKLREGLRRILKAQNVSVVMVTHDPEEALALGDQVALMRDGRIVEVATPEALFSNPKSPEGANIFPGSQVVEGIFEDGFLKTPVGDFAATSAEHGTGVAIIRKNALSAGSSDDHGFEVVDIRFSGPQWTAYLAPPGMTDPVRVDIAEPVALGSSLGLVFERDGVFIYKKQ